MYVYIRSEPGLYTVGFYDPAGKWQPESDHESRDEAAKRVAWLNGSTDANPELLESLKRLESRIAWRDDLHRWVIDDGSPSDFLTVDALRVARLAIAKATPAVKRTAQEVHP